MSRRAAIVLALVMALVAVAALFLRRAPAEKQEEADREAAIVAPSRVRQDEGEVRVVLDGAEQVRIGIAVAPLVRAEGGAGRRVPGQVVEEPERTAVIRAPVAGRLSEDSAPWPRLGARVAAGAELGRVSDARPLMAPIGGVVTRVGARPGEIVAEGQTLLELADRSRPVVRLTWPSAGAPPASVRLVPGARGVEADLIGPAPEADPLTRQPVYLYRARGAWPGAVPGTLVDALTPERGTAAGVLVPDRAVVQWDGLAWVYLQREPGRYVRVRVPTDRPASAGWIAGAPLEPGDTVVVTGAQELLSEEFRARVTVGDESGE
jgi:biotin carboxyl carrier protein